MTDFGRATGGYLSGIRDLHKRASSLLAEMEDYPDKQVQIVVGHFVHANGRPSLPGSDKWRHGHRNIGFEYADFPEDDRYYIVALLVDLIAVTNTFVKTGSCPKTKMSYEEAKARGNQLDRAEHEPGDPTCTCGHRGADG